MPIGGSLPGKELKWQYKNKQAFALTRFCPSPSAAERKRQNPLTGDSAGANKNNMLKKIILASFLLAFGFLPLASSARDLSAITDWYLKDFQTEIVVNPDSSLLITEKIIADCGNLPGKHGIFRVVPTAVNLPTGKVPTPVELVRITDFSGNPLKYQTSRNGGAITWKIGDPNVTVTGENEYEIVYKVKNAVRTQNGAVELYWNLNGNFWQIDADAFSADLKFPAGINEKNAKAGIYSGILGAKGDELAASRWNGDILHVQATRTMRAGEGITASVAMPENYFTPYKLTLSERFPFWPWVFPPILVFIVCFVIWKKYGDDQNLHKTVIAEYEAPDGLGPLEVGSISNNGFMDNKFITAAIIKLAADGALSITEEETKKLFVKIKDYRLEKINNPEAIAKLLPAETAIYEAIFNGAQSVLLSSLKNKFYKTVPDVAKKTKTWLVENGYMEKRGFELQAIMYGVGLGSLFFFLFGAKILSGTSFEDMFTIPFTVSSVIAIMIIIVFAVYMAKCTAKGAEAIWRIKGFKLFINTAEKYRAQFYENENMFEKVLPYAICFGLTKKWIQKTRAIYGDDKFAAMAPIWYVGASGFDADAFSTSMNSVAAAVAANTSSPSGQGGGGSAGGGGGGGGGGGW